MVFLAVAVAASGCATRAEQLEALDTTTSTMPRPTTTTLRPTPSTTTTLPKPPSVLLECPTGVTSPYGGTSRVQFGAQWQDASSSVVLWEIAYGDGKSYAVTTSEGAKHDLFWHVYAQPGVYQPFVTLTDATGETATATCNLTYTWDEPSSGGQGEGPSSTAWNDCYFNGTAMWGTVEIVDGPLAFPDFAVQVVNLLPDLKVQQVNSVLPPSACGEWEIVEGPLAFPDFTVEIVDGPLGFPDFTVQFVNSFPGR